jgi:hypothetical protein
MKKAALLLGGAAVLVAVAHPVSRVSVRPLT